MEPVYLDSAATTQILPEVRDEILYYLDVDFGNAGSRTHEYGARAKRRINQAREEVASVVGARPDEVVFTSGATESNNLAILGLARALRKESRTHILTTPIEHKAVLEPLESLSGCGFEVEFVPVRGDGSVAAGEVLSRLRGDTGLVSVMQVNNETGTVQPIGAIAEGLEQHSAFLHVDAAQGFGRIEEGLSHSRVDLISASAHKCYGPKGVGALIARRRRFNAPPLTPLTLGGGQERGLRPGTQAVHLAAGFGTAVALATANRARWAERCRAFGGRASEALSHLGAVVNGASEHQAPHILNVSIPGVDGEAALVATRELVAVATGSACTSESFERSHVLRAMKLDDGRIDSALRMSWDHRTPDPEWGLVVHALASLQARPGVAV